MTPGMFAEAVARIPVPVRADLAVHTLWDMQLDAPRDSDDLDSPDFVYASGWRAALDDIWATLQGAVPLYEFPPQPKGSFARTLARLPKVLRTTLAQTLAKDPTIRPSKWGSGVVEEELTFTHGYYDAVRRVVRALA
ncbi:MAG: hypothetical protein E4H01_10380 [Lysobacterales bacterium]|nr:MAG: hypothetical protein E4H01_10380 [Xanthomonadales bacterium]